MLLKPLEASAVIPYFYDLLPLIVHDPDDSIDRCELG